MIIVNGDRIKMDETLKVIGDRLRQIRLTRKMSQNELAEATDLSASFISNIEQGKQAMSVKALIAIAQVLDVSTDWLLLGKGRPFVSENEILADLENCSPQEKAIVMEFVQNMKDTILKLRNSGKE